MLDSVTILVFELFAMKDGACLPNKIIIMAESFECFSSWYKCQRLQPIKRECTIILMIYNSHEVLRELLYNCILVVFKRYIVSPQVADFSQWSKVCTYQGKYLLTKYEFPLAQ